MKTSFTKQGVYVPHYDRKIKSASRKTNLSQLVSGMILEQVTNWHEDSNYHLSLFYFIVKRLVLT